MPYTMDQLKDVNHQDDSILIGSMPKVNRKSAVKPGDITTFAAAICYIRSYLSHRGTISDEHVASGIVGLNANDHFEEWYENNHDFALILDNASDLEWSNGSPGLLTQYWNEIEQCMRRLEKTS